MADDLDPAAVAAERYPSDLLTTGGSAAKRDAFVAGARWALAAAPDGEAVDREALIEAEMMDWHEGRRSWANLGPHAPYTPDVIAVMDAQEVVKRAAILAAPTVTAEQVERLARQRADDAAVSRGGEPWRDDSWAHVRHDLIRVEAARLRKAGIEVREP